MVEDESAQRMPAAHKQGRCAVSSAIGSCISRTALGRVRLAFAVAIVAVCLVQGVRSDDESAPADGAQAAAPDAPVQQTTDSSAGTIENTTFKTEEMQAAAAEAVRRAERERDLEERIKFRAEMKAKEAAEMRAEEEKLRSVPVVYGAVIVIKNTRTQRLLSGSNFRYFHKLGSGQHQVHTAEVEDGYTHWRVMPRSGQRWELVKDVPVKHGEVIRLLNMRSQLNLHSHKGPKSPVSGHNEVSNFGQEYGSMDPNDNWVLDTNVGEGWFMGTGVDILHAPHRAQLLSHNRSTNATFGHHEVFCKMPGEEKGDADTAGGGTPHKGEWMVMPVTGGSLNEGFDRWVALFESQEDQHRKFEQVHADGGNGPKEISIYCPSNPAVSVSDLDYNLVSEGKCLALNLQSPHFEASLTLNCEPDNVKKGGGGRSKDEAEDGEQAKEEEEEEPEEA